MPHEQAAYCMDDILTQPFSFVALQEMLRKWCPDWDHA
jgi:hypothetical protein